jgi:hypothetical protein
MTDPLLDYDTLNAAIIRAVQAHKRIVDAHVYHAPIFRIEGGMIVDCVPHTQNVTDAGYVRELQEVLLAVYKLDIVSANHMLAQIKEQL